MDDLFPERPRITTYTPAFEDCWKVHRVGVKKAAWKAGRAAGFREANWVWLKQYLEKRHKEDAKWLEGKYVPHLSSIISGERWDDHYVKAEPKRDKYEQANQENPVIELTEEQRAKARQRMQRELAQLKVVS